MKNEFDLYGLKYNPVLKKLLITYVKHIYEENADVSDYSLWIEYNYLKNNDLLHLLFESEKRECPSRVVLS